MASFGVYIAIFLISLSSLAFEVLLTRVFSISQWNHLSFMVVSIALFGFGASGAFLSALGSRKKGWEKRLSGVTALKTTLSLYSFSAAGAYIALNEIPLDYFRLPMEPVQSLYLLFAYLALALPFFLTGLTISTGFAALPSDSGTLYFATMTGSAAGAILPIPLLPFCEEGRLAVLFAMAPLLFLLFPADSAETPATRRQRRTLLAAGAVIFASGLYLSFARDGALVRVTPSPYKALAQVLKFPDTRIVRSVSGVRGRIDVVESPHIRFAPGLSLKFHKSPPKQSAAFIDADSPYSLCEYSSPEDFQFMRYTVGYAPYILSPAPSRVLVIQTGGGSAVACALASGAGKIDVLESRPEIAKIVEAHYPVQAIDENPRSFLSRSKDRYQVIHIEDWGASIPGAAALEQDHVLTVESFAACLGLLDPNGAIAVSGKLVLPPANTLLLWATAYEALKEAGKKNPGDHLLMLRNWDVFTLVVSAAPVADGAGTADFAERMNFDPVYFPGMDESEANRFNVFDAPFYFREIQRLKAALESGSEKTYFKEHLLDITPRRDDRPFPNRFLKWTRLGDLYRATGSRFHGFLLSGEIVVAAVFVEALLVAFMLLALPMAAVSGKGGKPALVQLLFFSGVGAGFMFAEMYFINRFTLLFASPVISFTVVLSGMLVFSGIGGLLSRRMGLFALKGSLFGVVVLFFCVWAWLSPLVGTICGFGPTARYVFAYLLLLPAGLLLGVPFSLGMRLLLETPMERAYAWAANGCASVLASIACAQIAIGRGIGLLAFCAATAYLLALGVFFGKNRPRRVQ